jgi:hypothetical protein
MMSEEGSLFLEACGASGPLELEWDDWESGEAVRRVFVGPAVLVGRSPGADLSLAHPRVGRRHAYLQVIEGRLYAIDLEGRDRLRWSGVPRRSGWVDRRRPMQLGPTTIRVVAGDRAEGEEPGAGPGPLSSRFAGRQPLPGVLLRIAGAEGKPIQMAMDRVLALVGSSPECQVRLPEPGTSRYACALVRTPGGVWMVDLLSSRGVTLNGVACRQARLEDGDVLRVGGRAIRLTYDGPATRPRHRAAAGPIRPGDGPHLPAPVDLPDWPGRPPTDATQDALELVPELILGRLRGGGGPAPEEASAPFHHALLMLVRLLGDMHRDHLEVVREEMGQIRRLNREMGSLRDQLPRPDPTAGDVAGPVPAPEAGKDARPAPEAPPRDRQAPRAVQALVGERLAAWEKERQSRWRRVMDLLVKP